MSLARVLALFGRALLRRCPNCGGGPIFNRWFRMRDRCPRCGLELHRGEEGYQVGAYMFNIIAAELIFAALFVGVLVATWPDPPWNLLLYGGMGLIIVAPVVFYPFSRPSFWPLTWCSGRCCRPSGRRRSSSGVRIRTFYPSPMFAGHADCPVPACPSPFRGSHVSSARRRRVELRGALWSHPRLPS